MFIFLYKFNKEFLINVLYFICFFLFQQAVMFGLNTFYLKLLLGNIKHKDNGWSHTALSLISGGLSGATTLCMFYPLLFCQTHLAAHVGPLVDREYTGLLDCIQKTVHTNGVRALYTGKP